MLLTLAYASVVVSPVDTYDTACLFFCFFCVVLLLLLGSWLSSCVFGVVSKLLL